MRYAERMQRRFGTGADFSSAEAEFTGRIEYLGPEPTFVSGRVPAVQKVGLTVTEVVRGDLQPGDQIEIDVPIESGFAPVTTGSNGIAALDPGLLPVGSTLAFSSSWTGDTWLAVNMDAGAGAPTNYAGVRTRHH